MRLYGQKFLPLHRDLGCFNREIGRPGLHVNTCGKNNSKLSINLVDNIFNNYKYTSFLDEWSIFPRREVCDPHCTPLLAPQPETFIDLLVTTLEHKEPLSQFAYMLLMYIRLKLWKVHRSCFVF